MQKWYFDCFGIWIHIHWIWNHMSEYGFATFAYEKSFLICKTATFAHEKSFLICKTAIFAHEKSFFAYEIFVFAYEKSFSVYENNEYLWNRHKFTILAICYDIF